MSTLQTSERDFVTSLIFSVSLFNFIKENLHSASKQKPLREMKTAQILPRVSGGIVKTLCYSIQKGREILALLRSRLFCDLQTCYYLPQA